MSAPFELMTKALIDIAGRQQQMLAIIRENGFVFESIGREPGNWQHLAFTLYNEICDIDVIARVAIGLEVGDQPPEGPE